MAHRPSRLKRLLCHIAYLLRRLLERYCPPQRGSQLRPTLHSFMPGQISVLAELRPASDVDGGDWLPPPERISDLIRVQLLSLLGDQPATIDPSRLVLLRGIDRALAAQFVALPRLRDNPAELLDLVEQINRRLEAGGIARPGLEAAQRSAGQADSSAEADQSEVRLQLRVASPNWLGSASQQIGTTGGPGARPVLVEPPQASASDDAPAPWAYTLAPAMLPSPQARIGASRPVTVAVLDTAPQLRDLERAHRRWVSQAEAPHPLLAQLCGPAGAFAVGPSERLELTYAPIDLLAWADADLDAHRYAMSDHGLFIAGIIASIAPEARLHLVEVLNPYGAGTLESLVWGLRTVIERHRGEREAALVINCSLTINSPAPYVEAIRRQAEECSDVATLTPARVLNQNRLLELVLEFLDQLDNVVVVAAAGNDGWPRYRHPPARFPAAYQQVVGVGALSTQVKPAVYSNTADSPSGKGFAVFGGNVVSNQPGLFEADPAQGVLGVYIGATPDKQPNQSGWARWAGTSFAAPVVSAALARWLATGQKAQKIVNDLGLEGANSPFGELFEVKQGS